MNELTNDQRAYVDGLHELADFLATQPELLDRATFSRSEFYIFAWDAPTFARLALALGTATKRSDNTHYNVERKFGPILLQVTARHEVVCERVVVGSETVEVTGPDPEAVAALPVTTRTETIEKIEWICPPNLHDLAGE